MFKRYARKVEAGGTIPDLFEEDLSKYENPIKVGIDKWKVSREGKQLYSKYFNGCTALALYTSVNEPSGFYHIHGLPDDLDSLIEEISEDGNDGEPLYVKIAGQQRMVEEISNMLLDKGVQIEKQKQIGNYFGKIQF